MKVKLAEVVLKDTFKHPGVPAWDGFASAAFNTHSKHKFELEYDTDLQLVHIRAGGKTVSVHTSQTKTMVLMEDASAPLPDPVANVPKTGKALSGAALRAQQAKADAEKGFTKTPDPV